MFIRSRRVILPELLDEQAPEAGKQSLRDLVRINRYLGGHEATRKALKGIVPDGEFTMLDVGAASGDTARAVRARYPAGQVTSLDYRVHHLKAAPPPKVVGDAFHMPFRAKSYDIVHCSLFLHHFSNDDIVRLLATFRDMARMAVVINDLERHVLAFRFLPWTRWLLRWDRITLHDGPISVQAGFRVDELKSLATQAGLRDLQTRVYRPAFRITLAGRP